MKARFISKSISEAEKEKYKNNIYIKQSFLSLTLGEIYLIMGVELLDDGLVLFHCYNPLVSYIVMYPSCLFEVVDNKVSKYWKIDIHSSSISFFPEEFDIEYFHDDLSEGVTEIRQKFNNLVSLMLEE
jgi:hypothetical protein